LSETAHQGKRNSPEFAVRKCPALWKSGRELAHAVLELPPPQSGLQSSVSKIPEDSYDLAAGKWSAVLLHRPCLQACRKRSALRASAVPCLVFRNHADLQLRDHRNAVEL